MTDRDPDYVVLGETRTYSFEAITKAIRLIDGRRAVHRDQPRPERARAPQGMLPATGSVAALISTATGRQPYFIGKPNPLMMRSALNRLEAHSETTVMVGDRMDTDIISGLEAGLRTVLVSTGSTRPEQVEHFPYRPTRVVDSIADLVPLVTAAGRGGGRVSAGPSCTSPRSRTGRRRCAPASTAGRPSAARSRRRASSTAPRPSRCPACSRRYYASYPDDLLLLTVDPERLTAPLQWDVVNTVTGERFPHVYGPITPDAVTRTQVLHPPHGEPSRHEFDQAYWDEHYEQGAAGASAGHQLPPNPYLVEEVGA